MMKFTVLPVCLMVALLGHAWGAAVLERHKRQAWNDPDHPFPDSSWSDWTPCTANCGGGYQGRHACAYTYQFSPPITGPPFIFGPTDPPGCPLTVAGCGGRPCSDEFDWQPFEECSVACGTGTRRRYSGPGCVALNCPLGDYYYQEIACHAQACNMTQCGKADIVLVLDSSGSVGDFHWFTEKQFAIDLIKGLDIASDETRVSVVTYSTEVQLNFGFAQHTTVAALESAIWAMPYMAASTNTADGIRLARQVFEDQARLGIKKVMVVVTDGNSNILPDTTIPQADFARGDSILVFAVGIGLNNNDAELLGIGNTPADTFVHYASDFEALAEIVQEVINGTCVTEVECCDWGDWSNCSADCDGGTHSRSRTCTQYIGGVVDSTWTEQQSCPCNTEPCPVIVECGDWTAWCPCSVTCGGGYQYRSRQCSKSVSGVVRDLWTERANQTCGECECPTVVCGEWIPDGSCSEPCGGGQQKMVRCCKTYLGTTLLASDTEVRYDDCNTHICCNIHTCGPDCSQCPYENDYGYLPNPYDICSFYMCRRVAAGAGQYTYSYTAMPCAPGTQWDQSLLTCVHATGGNCPGCVVVVPTEPWVCNLESVDDITKFKDLTTGIIMPCAAGTVFDQDECVCVHGYNPAPVTPACDGPLLYFPFDDDFTSVGCETVDAYPAGTGTVSLVWDCKRGKSAKFNGDSLLLVYFLKNYFANNNVQAFTVALYFKWTGSTSGIGGLVNNGNCETGSSFDIRVGIGEVVSASLGTDVINYQSTGTFSVQRWNWIHVAEVYDGSTLKLYINGAVASSTSLTGPMENSQCSMIIGQMGHDDSSSGFFTGHIDELMVFMRALSGNQVQDLVNLNYGPNGPTA